jgi:hypothetical protein
MGGRECGEQQNSEYNCPDRTHITALPGAHFAARERSVKLEAPSQLLPRDCRATQA